jgi:hypothetical protein
MSSAAKTLAPKKSTAKKAVKPQKKTLIGSTKTKEEVKIYSFIYQKTPLRDALCLDFASQPQSLSSFHGSPISRDNNRQLSRRAENHFRSDSSFPGVVIFIIFLPKFTKLV